MGMQEQMRMKDEEIRILKAQLAKETSLKLEVQVEETPSDIQFEVTEVAVAKNKREVALAKNERDEDEEELEVKSESSPPKRMKTSSRSKTEFCSKIEDEVKAKPEDKDNTLLSYLSEPQIDGMVPSSKDLFEPPTLEGVSVPVSVPTADELHTLPALPLDDLLQALDPFNKHEPLEHAGLQGLPPGSDSMTLKGVP